MRRLVLPVGTGLLMLVILGIAGAGPYVGSMKSRQSGAFREHWKETLGRRPSLDQLRSEAGRSPGTLFSARSFRDGGWVVALAHNSHSHDLRDEWEGAILADNRGKLYWTRHHFCGSEGLEAELGRIQAGSREQFWKVAAGLGITRL